MDNNNRKKPNVIKNYFYNLSYKLLAILVPLITTPYIARVLKAEAIGAFSYTQSIATYFSIFGIMGLDLYGQLQISRFRDNKKNLSQSFTEILIAKTITSIMSILLYSCFIIVYGQYTILLTIMGTMIVANAIDISWLFQGLEEFKKIVIRNYIVKLAGLALILAFVKKEEDVFLYAIIIQGSSLLGNISLWYKITRYVDFAQIHWERVLKHINNSLIYFLPAIATTIYTSTDKVMLGAIIHSDYQNGIYDQAHKIEQVIITIVSSMSTVLLPRLAYLYSNDDNETLNRYIGYAISVVGLIEIPIMCGLCGIADVFIPVFLGSGFMECIDLIRIFSIMILFSGINTMLGNSCLVAQGKQKCYNIGVFAGATINIALNTVLIPRYSSYGAAGASLAAEITVFAVFLYYSKNEYISLKTILHKWTKYFVAAIPMGLAVKRIGNTFGGGIKILFIQIALGVLIYSVLVLLQKDEFVQKLIKRQ